MAEAFLYYNDNIAKKSQIEMKSSGLAIRTFTYVVDVLDGILRIILKGEKGQAYNIADSTQTMSIKEFAERLIAEFKERKIKLFMICVTTDSNSAGDVFFRIHDFIYPHFKQLAYNYNYAIIKTNANKKTIYRRKKLCRF